MIRDSDPSYDNGLPSFQVHTAVAGKTKQGNGFFISVQNLVGAVLIFYIGVIAGRFTDEKDYAIQDKIVYDNYRVQVHDEINRAVHKDKQDDTNKDDDDQHLEYDLFETFLGNGLPLDHKAVMNPNVYTLVQDSPAFAIADLKELQITPLHWASNGKQVNRDARVIGLPTMLTHELQAFCEDTGINRLFHWAAVSSTLKVNETITTGPGDIKEGHNWAATRASYGTDENDNDLHWLDAVDETSFEKTVDVLKRGMFDDVLDVIAAEFGPWGYSFVGMGFTVGSYNVGSRIHRVNPKVGQNVLKLVVPIILPKHDQTQLYVGNEDDGKVAALNLEYHKGILLSANTTHGVGDFDYQGENEDLMVFASIYIADINKHNVDRVADIITALFSMHGQTEWLIAQRGRFWGGTYGGSFDHDKGRKPFTARDELENCPQLAQHGMCDDESKSEGGLSFLDVRTKCPRSCEIYIDDETYFSQVRLPPKPQPMQHTEA